MIPGKSARSVTARMFTDLFRINCRLPQTPRTGTAAASHYFDDVFTRQRRNSQTRKPSTLRRSSTHRSLGMRSDWESAPVSEHDDETDGVATPNGTDGRDPETGRRWTIFQDDHDDDHKAKESADEHVHNYVQDQLKRLMSPDGPSRYEDEIEAKYDSM